MTIISREHKPARKIEIDLSGPEGNAINIIGMARKLARDFGLDDKAITSEMMSGDYDNLIEVFDKNFGSFVTIYK